MASLVPQRIMSDGIFEQSLGCSEVCVGVKLGLRGCVAGDVESATHDRDQSNARKCDRILELGQSQVLQGADGSNTNRSGRIGGQMRKYRVFRRIRRGLEWMRDVHVVGILR